MIDLHAALRRCQKEADRYRLLAEQSTDLISRHSATPEWTFIDVNPAIEPLLGYKAEEIIGTSGYALFHPQDADNLKTVVVMLYIVMAFIPTLTVIAINWVITSGLKPPAEPFGMNRVNQLK